MTWTSDDITSALYIAVAVLLLITLYHVIFIVVDLRKVMRRLETMTQEVEAVLMKPLAMTDKALEWMIHFFEQKAGEKSHHKKQVP